MDGKTRDIAHVLSPVLLEGEITLSQCFKLYFCLRPVGEVGAYDGLNGQTPQCICSMSVDYNDSIGVALTFIE